MVKHQCGYLSDCCEALPVDKLDSDDKGVFGTCSDCDDVSSFECSGHTPWDDDSKWFM
jgi:hypothetical protein